MGGSSRTSPRLPSFCFNRIAARVRVRSPPPSERKPPPPPPADNAVEPNPAEEEAEVASIGRRRIMIVVDTSPESKTAMLWALSHAVQTSDCVVLVNAVRPSSKHVNLMSNRLNLLHRKDYKKGINMIIIVSGKAECILLRKISMTQAGKYIDFRKPKATCFNRRGVTISVDDENVNVCQVVVEVSVVEATERGAAILEEARKQGASLLVMGQKKRSFTWRLVMLWAGNKISGSVADYCVQNATCMAVAVRRKSRRGGGYLITTKRHKDFWLLA
ncbi:hypothetical protein ZIOFF_007624 [Zingiber officinale]|uniref:UspA domain-containing protein n=1 Tax=Zingiber officinale TaxID=94328 RepID=A0A8J5IGS5_ZINOF|nr:hypothetical protein ZIOFF_007624 [Zingiber officinale]